MKRILVENSYYKKTALLQDDELIELIIEDENQNVAIGNIYSGVVKKILPTQFAFIDIGQGDTAFLYLNDSKEANLYKYNPLTEKNELTIKQGQSVLVQVIKEKNDSKCAVVTTSINLSGKYAVLIPNQRGCFISKKIEDEAEIQRLKGIASALCNDEVGIILRTNSVKIQDEILTEEIGSLKKIYNDIVKKHTYCIPPSLIYSTQKETNSLIRDLIKKDDEVIVSSKELFDELKSEFRKINIKLHNENIPLFSKFNLQSQIKKALHNKIWLKNGGFIVIDETEAMCVIDVNTGKYTGKNHKDTIMGTNLEAAYESMKQIRLRNLSGMILIDFIDMTEEEDREKLLQTLKILAKKDRINTNIVSITELGLVQLTRKKTRLPLKKYLCCSCPLCNGKGDVFSDYYISDKIRDEIMLIFSQTIYKKVTVLSNKRVLDILKKANLESLEEKFGRKIYFEEIETTLYDYYELKKDV